MCKRKAACASDCGKNGKAQSEACDVDSLRNDKFRGLTRPLRLHRQTQLWEAVSRDGQMDGIK
jgi:hypothetical protein